MSKVPYASTMGSLMYAMVCTRPDIAHVVGTVSRFLSNPGREHWNVVKWILRYLHAYFGGILRLICLETLIPKSLLLFIALSTTEIEFIVITKACKELLWVKKQELDFVQDKYLLFYDSQSAIHLGKNSTFHSRSKHIDLRYHWICDVLDAKLLRLTKVHTDDNGADIMIKVIPRGKFEACCEIARLAITST
ncbi:hypothetical protein CR513_16426, partial [Mucuna pruriens]